MISHCQFLKNISGVFLGGFEGNVTFQKGDLVVGDHLVDDRGSQSLDTRV
jgi:hypothetical protein